jgi:hypothetical protein
VTVNLSCTVASAQVQSSITIPANTAVITFPVTTTPVGTNTANYLNGSLNGTTLSAGFTETASPPSAPSGLTAAGGNNNVSLSWSAAAGATSYKVYRGTTAGGETSTPVASGITSTSYTDGGVVGGATYYYKVTGVNADGESGKSNEASVVLPAQPSITSSTSATGYVGTAFTYQITATNTPTRYNAVGLPTGLSINTTTGVISGTPSAMGQWSVSITASNGGGSGTATLTITVVMQPTAPYVCTP